MATPDATSSAAWPEIAKAKADGRHEIVLSGPEISTRISERPGLDLPVELFALHSVNYLDISGTSLLNLSDLLGELEMLQNLVLRVCSWLLCPNTFYIILNRYLWKYLVKILNILSFSILIMWNCGLTLLDSKGSITRYIVVWTKILKNLFAHQLMAWAVWDRSALSSASFGRKCNWMTCYFLFRDGSKDVLYTFVKHLLWRLRGLIDNGSRHNLVGEGYSKQLYINSIFLS